jgi:hypothetical protein
MEISAGLPLLFVSDNDGSARIRERGGTLAVEEANLEMEHGHPDPRNGRVTSVPAQPMKVPKFVDTS